MQQAFESDCVRERACVTRWRVSYARTYARTYVRTYATPSFPHTRMRRACKQSSDVGRLMSFRLPARDNVWPAYAGVQVRSFVTWRGCQGVRTGSVACECLSVVVAACVHGQHGLVDSRPSRVPRTPSVLVRNCVSFGKDD